MKKWIVFIIVIIIAGIYFGKSWYEYEKTKVRVNILENIHLIDSITITDSKTKDEVFIVNQSDPFFTEMVNVFDLQYMNLDRQEKQMLKGDPLWDILYKTKDQVKYTVSIYQVGNEWEDMLEDVYERATVDTIVEDYSYVYFPHDETDGYVFAIKENKELLGINEGLEELIERIGYIFKGN